MLFTHNNNNDFWFLYDRRTYLDLVPKRKPPGIATEDFHRSDALPVGLTTNQQTVCCIKALKEINMQNGASSSEIFNKCGNNAISSVVTIQSNKQR